MISAALVSDIWTRGCGSGVLRWRCVTRFINKGRGVLHCTISRGHEEWRVCQHPPRIEIDCLEIDVSKGSNNNLKLEKVIITYTRTKEAPILSQFTEDSKDIRYRWLKIATNNFWQKMTWRVWRGIRSAFSLNLIQRTNNSWNRSQKDRYVSNSLRSGCC